MTKFPLPTTEQAHFAKSYSALLTELGYSPRNSTARRTLKALIQKHYPNSPLLTSRRGLIVSDNEFTSFVLESTSLQQLILKCGYKLAGGTYVVVQKRINRLNLSISHFTGMAHNRGKPKPNKEIHEYLIQGKAVQGTRLREKLITAGLKHRCCEHCKGTEWMGHPIPLEVDHINGIHDDNRLENLRLLCPNCHTLTPTYGRRKKPTKPCACGKPKKQSKAATCGGYTCVSKYVSEQTKKRKNGGRGRTRTDTISPA